MIAAILAAAADALVHTARQKRLVKESKSRRRPLGGRQHEAQKTEDSPRSSASQGNVQGNERGQKQPFSDFS